MAAACLPTDKAPLPWPGCIWSPSLPLCRYQLIYACGTAGALPSGHERACVVQALLRVVSQLGDAATSLLRAREGVAVWAGHDSR